jgi:hypothetical protein
MFCFNFGSWKQNGNHSVSLPMEENGKQRCKGRK